MIAGFYTGFPALPVLPNHEAVAFLPVPAAGFVVAVAVRGVFFGGGRLHMGGQQG